MSKFAVKMLEGCEIFSNIEFFVISYYHPYALYHPLAAYFLQAILLRAWYQRAWSANGRSLQKGLAC